MLLFVSAGWRGVSVQTNLRWSLHVTSRQRVVSLHAAECAAAEKLISFLACKLTALFPDEWVFGHSFNKRKCRTRRVCSCAVWLSVTFCFAYDRTLMLLAYARFDWLYRNKVSSYVDNSIPLN